MSQDIETWMRDVERRLTELDRRIRSKSSGGMALAAPAETPTDEPENT